MKKIVLIVLALLIIALLVSMALIEYGYINHKHGDNILKTIPFVVLENIPTLRAYDYSALHRLIKKCNRVSNAGPQGDYNICCPSFFAISRIVSGGKDYPFESFLSTTEPRNLPQDCYGLINVIPTKGGDCYRIHNWEISLSADKHAIEICPPKEL